MSIRSTDVPPIRFARSGNARLAYQVFGDGPATIVAIPPTAQHIEMGWERPEIRAMLERFASFSRYLHFDKRGTGASDRRSHIPGIDERVADLEAVMDDAGIHRAHLFACSEGGPMAIMFAATYPDRVDSLILAGSCASQLPAGTTPEQREERRRRHEVFIGLWGTEDSPVADGFAPSLACDPEFRAWHQRYERTAASTESLRDLLDLTLEMDVRELLPTLTVPTLVVHRRGDRVIPIELGRELAETIPGAVMYEQDGDDHFQYAGDVDGWMTEVERFVTGRVSPPPTRRPTPTVRVITLGRFAVERDGEEVPVSEWGSRLARQILKRLVATRGWPVTREELIDMCWPDETDMAKLGARLSVQLSAVRRVLDGGVIADRSSVRLDLDHVATDLEAFHRADDDAAVTAAYTGEFLPDDRYEDWTAPTRTEARTRFVTAARRLASACMERGEHRRALWTAQRLIDVDRYDADAHRLCVTALVALGEPGEAARAHGEWEQAMTDLGVDVEPLDQLVS